MAEARFDCAVVLEVRRMHQPQVVLVIVQRGEQALRCRVDRHLDHGAVHQRALASGSAGALEGGNDALGARDFGALRCKHAIDCGRVARCDKALRAVAKPLRVTRVGRGAARVTERVRAIDGLDPRRPAFDEKARAHVGEFLLLGYDLDGDVVRQRVELVR